MVDCPIGFGMTPSLVQPSMIPIGGIINWSGTILAIPENFQLCDGTNGTPDLRNNFVIGAGDTHAVDDTGGTLTHTHSTSAPLDTAGAGPEPAWSAALSSDPAGTLPPFLALAYIQRMS